MSQCGTVLGAEEAEEGEWSSNYSRQGTCWPVVLDCKNVDLLLVKSERLKSVVGWTDSVAVAGMELVGRLEVAAVVAIAVVEPTVAALAAAA